MSDTPRRRLSDRVSASPTLIGAGSHFTGNLTCESDLVIAGLVNGDGSVRGALTLSEGGRWEGNVHATHAVVAGEIQGSITVAEKLEIRKSARIRGSVKAKTIAIAEGGVIDGEMAVTSETPVVRYEEKRKDV
ncbi:MAG TPA: polymer-forming cytoskeletal protein [Steroidobacteraceae bacterium]|nr:polymer-forming cytoskeletal protein [Steroidobacteraceae bacterium]